MIKYVMAIGAALALCMGCSVNTEKCLEKEGFKNCDDFSAAAKKAQGNDEAYRFHTIAKKCHCQE
jgi:hypothetical protein